MSWRGQLRQRRVVPGGVSGMCSTAADGFNCVLLSSCVIMPFESWATSAADRPITVGETSHYIKATRGPCPRVAFFCWLAQEVVTGGLSEAPDDVCRSGQKASIETKR